MKLIMTIGPVQGFVAQSRTTRDLWSSSYLLSYLSAHAIYGALKITGAGSLVKPLVEKDPLYLWVSRSTEKPSNPPLMGSIPNQFEIDCKSFEPQMVAGSAIAEFQKAWQHIAAQVFEKFIRRSISYGQNVEEIWQRQVASFFEITWVAAEDTQGLLQRRKAFRNHFPPDEPGDKCMLMPQLQEISGYCRANQRQKQDQFYAELRGLDLKSNERLCAISLIKRLVPRLTEDCFGFKLPVTRWPSAEDICLRDKDANRDGAPSYYALLLADGDKLGALLGSLGAATVSKGLADFTKAVPDCIEKKYKGEAIYAGGDDVLAVLPVSQALNCAQDIRELYKKSLKSDQATLSTALVFAKREAPLPEILRQAHRLLDEIAKDRNGRDSIACGILRDHNLACEWSSTWDRQNISATQLLHKVSEALKSQEKDVSRSLVNRLKSLMGRLLDLKLTEPGSNVPLPETNDSINQGHFLVKVLKSEIQQSWMHQDKNRELETCGQIASDLFELMRQSQREVQGKLKPPLLLGVDGLVLVLFLANGGYEEQHGENS